MLLVAGERSGKSGLLTGVARELSLHMCYFANAKSLKAELQGRSRRIVLLTEPDVSDDVLGALESARSGPDLGLIVCANRAALRLSRQAELLRRLGDFDNIEWVGEDYDVDALCRAARSCRRRMLRVSRSEIEEALRRREFLIQYQPKVERNSGSEWLTREAEALLRWRHPVHGLLGPLEFLPEVDAFDMAAPVSDYVLDEAARQLAAWRDRGLRLNSCINLAPGLLNNPNLPNNCEAIVRKHGLDCASFTFEVAEHDVANSDAPHLKVLKALREKGFRISLDDFGVAAASLGTFEQLPFDEIKIHAAALNRAKANPVAQKVLAAVTGLAHNLGISVCAEGVEDYETFEFLTTIECDKMQGFLISEAVMPDIIRRVYGPKADPEVEEVA